MSTPNTKSFPFTVEVIHEASGEMDKKFSFPEESKKHTTAAIILNDTKTSVR